MKSRDEVYNLHCPFDIDKHKRNYVHYLEVVIKEDGTIEYAVPSHQHKLLEVASRRLGVPKQKIVEDCPKSMYADYTVYLCRISKCISVWENFIIYDEINEKQIASLMLLRFHGLYCGNIPETVLQGVNHAGSNI